MEVDISWLELPESTKKPDAPRPEVKKPEPRKKPPRMPGATVTVPPLPVAAAPPSTRNTIEVDMEWVELVDENGKVEKKLVERRAEKKK